MTIERPTWRIGDGREIALDRPCLAGILNVTPDSFSDGGRYLDPHAALGHAARMAEEGAHIIDVGGESTRPGATRVDPHEQIARIAPVIERIGATLETPVSVDTTSSAVARAALDAGAAIINDVSAGTEDDEILALTAERGCGLILMHRLRPPHVESYSHEYQRPPEYDDVVESVRSFLSDRIEAACRAGVEREAIVIDPGLGFGKTVAQNYELIARIDELEMLGRPILGGASRKSFVGHSTGIDDPARRVIGSTAISVAMYFSGVRIFRVHDVAAHAEALAVAEAIASRAPAGGAPASDSLQTTT